MAMTTPSAEQISYADAVNRALNLFVASLLGITALAFGSDLLVETDPIDKVDNSLLVLVGVVAVAWYFMRGNWAKRSSMPVVLAGAALVAQIIGFVIEINDPNALGDDIPGLLVFVPGLIIAALLYRANGRYLAAGPRASS